MTIRIAMWSGPRNISTALMRSFGSRPDTAVCDEPLYAHYLLQTGKRHPGFEEVIASHETNWRKVVAQLTGPVPGGKPVYYQKHMAHHLLPQVERAWIRELRNAFLLRDPDAMLASLVRVMPEPSLEDTGLPQQVELFEGLCEDSGRAPPVIDARDVLERPRETLSLLCQALGVAFTDAMLSWEPGRRDTDGVWARHWYEAVDRSTGFEPYRPRAVSVPGRLRPLRDECRTLYATLARHRLVPSGPGG